MKSGNKNTTDPYIHVLEHPIPNYIHIMKGNTVINNSHARPGYTYQEGYYWERPSLKKKLNLSEVYWRNGR